MRDQMGNQISTDATGHEGQNRAHVSHFRKSRQLFHKLRNMNRAWNCKYATALNYRNTVVEDGEMLKSRLAALPYE